jgi:hypothetical protein
MLLLRVAWRVCTLMHLVSCRYRLRGAKFFCVRRGNQRLSWMRAAAFCRTLRNRPQAECACHGSHPLSPHSIPLGFHRSSGELALVAVCTGSFTWYMRRIVLTQTCDTIHCCKMMWDCLKRHKRGNRARVVITELPLHPPIRPKSTVYSLYLKYFHGFAPYIKSALFIRERIY